MQRSTKHALLILLSFLLIVFFVFEKDFSNKASAIHEPAPRNNVSHLSGYAWSNNIGWISFRNLNEPGAIPYGVDVDFGNNGLLSGYAWSSNVGWISFGCGNDDDGSTNRKVCVDSSGTGFPSGTPSPFGARLDTSSNTLRGFARACSVFQSGCSGDLWGPLELGGWDGWISLDGQALDGGVYGATLNSSDRLIGFAWGGGVEDDGFGDNISPQFPGWIQFNPTNTKDDVRLCDDPFCGEEIQSGVVCTRSSYPIVGEVVTWRADLSSAVSYNWTVDINDPLNPPVPKPAKGTAPNADYVVVGGSLNSNEVSIRYLTEGPRITRVSVDDGTGGSLLSCNPDTVGLTEFDVLPKGFEILSSGKMTARFIRSIRAVTFPDIELSAVANGDFSEALNFEFISIVDPGGQQRAGAGSDNSLLVSASFSPVAVINKDDTTLDANDYQKIKLRLNITKNQNVNADLVSGEYKVFIRATSATSGIVRERALDLKIDNPSGGVIEL